MAKVAAQPVSAKNYFKKRETTITRNVLMELGRQKRLLRLKRESSNYFIIREEVLALKKAPITALQTMEALAEIKKYKNPFVGKNGIPLERKDHLFFAFEQNRRNLIVSLLSGKERTNFLNAEANLNNKMNS